MNNNEDWERRFQELEVEVNNPEPEKPIDLSQPFEKNFSPLKQWYSNLSTPAQAAVAIVGIIVVFSVLNSVLKLVASLLTITILGVVLYGAYKFFIASSSNQRD